MRFHVGTMGFSYTDWQGAFYPDTVRPGDFLRAYATAFDAVEVDSTFHAIPGVERVRKWAEVLPEGFVFCPRPREITHDAPLSAGVGVMKTFARVLEPMRIAGKLGPILFQFPPAFSRGNEHELRAFLKQLPADHRYALEFRHRSWRHPAIEELLAAHRCAWVAADHGVEPWPVRATTDFMYVRLIGVHKTFASHERERLDTTTRLRWWVEQIQAAGEGKVKQVLVFVGNDFSGHAPAAVNRLRALVGEPVKEVMEEKKRSEQGALF